MLELAKRAHSLLIANFILSFGVVSPLANQGQTRNLGSEPPISVSISSITSRISPGLPLTLTVKMTNISVHEVTYWRENASDPADYTYFVDVADSKSRRPPDTKFGQTIRLRHDPKFMPDARRPNGSGGWVPLKAGESVIDDVHVSKLYDLSRPGKYTIQVETFDDYTETFVKSNKVTVTVQ